MHHSTASTVSVGRTFALPAPTPASQSDHDSWRRPICTDACSRVRVLVADGEYRGWRDVEHHDHGAYERVLEQVVLLLSAGLADPAGLAVRTGPLAVDLLTANVHVGGRRLAVTALEWALLEILARHVGLVVARGVLVRWIWSERDPGWIERRGYPRLRMLARRLRARLGAAAPLVVTASGVGMMLDSAEVV
jgi:DNA-binding response OmpR family regulator